jgi:PIN domain nuclease of toxin-antitoxin system
MKILIDSHIVLALLMENYKKISKQEKKLLFDTQNTIFVSYVTFWELSIKCKKGQIKYSYKELFGALVSGAFSILPIGLDHIKNLDLLDPIHGDPFDRMLISQAITEQYTLITHDVKILEYPVGVFL